MKKSKLLTVIGARPHFMKAAPLSKEIAKSENLEEVIVHTGQHYDQNLSAQFFKELPLDKPKYNLEVGSGSPVWQLGQMLISLNEVIQLENPDLIIVFGDTNTTAAGAIAAAKSNIPLAHVEAGLREFDKSIPEEINKLLIDSVTDLFFVPTKTGVQNLKNEGVTKHVYLVGDVVLDLIQQNLERIQQNQNILKKFGLVSGQYIFFTCHRQANTKSETILENILESITLLTEKTIFPIHPRTKNAISKFGLDSYLTAPNIILVEPLGYWDTQTLIRNSRMVVTDSGGVTKEAYFHRKPSIVIDKQTEWVEIIEEGWCHVTGPNKEKILEKAISFPKPNRHTNCIGDGLTSKRIVEAIKDFLNV